MPELKEKLEKILGEKQKLSPEVLKKGITAFGIEGNLEEGFGGDLPVKLFETEEEMQADPTAKEGDLAVVYKESIVPMTTDSVVNKMHFDDTITLAEAFTDSVYTSLRSNRDSDNYLDIMVMIDPNSARIDGYRKW